MDSPRTDETSTESENTQQKSSNLDCVQAQPKDNNFIPNKPVKYLEKTTVIQLIFFKDPKGRVIMTNGGAYYGNDLGKFNCDCVDTFCHIKVSK